MGTIRSLLSVFIILSTQLAVISNAAKSEVIESSPLEQKRFVRSSYPRRRILQQQQQKQNERNEDVLGTALHLQSVIGTQPQLPITSTVYDKVDYSCNNQYGSSYRTIDQENGVVAKQRADDNNNRIAILHIGPLKTASTSIQVDMKNLRSELTMDNYKLPVAPGEINMGEIRYCFIYGHTCDPKIVENVHQLGKDVDHKRQNMIITAESFSFPDTNIAELKKIIDTYWSETIIVLYYRRYYDWLYSNWNQLAKFENYHTRDSWVDYMVKDLYSGPPSKPDNQFYASHYAYGLYPRWRGFYPATTQLYNVHDESKMTNTEKFFCAALVNATTTCNKIRELEKHKGEDHFNQGHHLIYEDLALLAIEQKLIPVRNEGDKPLTVKENQKQVIQIIQYQQEKVWNLGKYDFIKSSVSCLPEMILNDLLHKTLIAEEDLFPAYYASSEGEAVIRDKFDADKTTKLCSIDAGTVLKDDLKWKAFFRSSKDYYDAYDAVILKKKTRGGKD